MSILDARKKSVVHIECATSENSLIKQTSQIKDLWRKLDAKEISFEEFSSLVMNITFRNLRSQGTAIILQYNNHRYLVTAQHVVKKQQKDEWEIKDSIQNLIFRVPSLDEVLMHELPYPQYSFDNLGNIFTDDTFPIPLMNLGAGPSGISPYTFSDPELDLAIISLDQRDTLFANQLLSLGYIPITVEDIGDEPSAEGAYVFSIGYPSATALITSLNLPRPVQNWMSSFVSTPTFSFGRVAMLHERLPFYWCDISIYPGNSGGPIYENGILVGVVSAQPVLQSEILSKNTNMEQPFVARTRIPFGKIIKAKFIKDLLDIQIRKDNILRDPLK